MIRDPRSEAWPWGADRICRAILGAAAVFLLTAAGPAAAQGIETTIDRTEATLQDYLMLTVTVRGSQGAQPELPELPDFDVIPRGQASQLDIRNGRTTASISHNFLLAPRRTGTFTIGPARVEIGGRDYASEPIRVRILEPSETPQEPRNVFITATVSTTEPWVGQQVIYTWRLYHRTQVGDANLEPQEFDGFLVENLGEVRQFETTVNGQVFHVSELKKALFPQEVGELTVPGSVLHCRVAVERGERRQSLFEDFFGRVAVEPKVLRSAPIGLEVRPLPPAPPGFSGLVGDFDLDVRISKRELAVGESATLSLTVSGTGNVQMISEPELPELPLFKIYDDKPASSFDREGGALSGSKSFSKALVPLEAGELSLPTVALTYFEPRQGAYRTVRTGAITLSIAPAAGEEELRLTESVAPTTGKVAVRILADDILPVYKGLDAVTTERAGPLGDPALLGGLAMPALLFVGLLGLQHRRQQFAADRGLRRRRAALRTARHGLSELASAVSSPEAAQVASRVLRGYVGDKLGLEGTALTPAEAADRLRAAGLEEAEAVRVQGLLEHLEAAQYGAATVSAEGLPGQLRLLLETLERRLA